MFTFISYVYKYKAVFQILPNSLTDSWLISYQSSCKIINKILIMMKVGVELKC